ncbi:hypothetical protein [Vibrio cidicii]|uniref:hypothetical protein n=1 Tax=Vibrio cidicii TaxID=1763883 RepID=UPI000AE34511|nr:hypothetical protein [Vibrio cidicii]
MKNKRHRKVAFEVLKKIGLVELLFHLSRYVINARGIWFAPVVLYPLTTHPTVQFAP